MQHARIAAAKLTGKLEVIVAVGRIDSIGRFKPFGQAYVVADVQHKEGEWEVEVAGAVVPYLHPSPRLVTHVGTFIVNRWFIDPLPTPMHMDNRAAATVGATHILPGVPE